MAKRISKADLKAIREYRGYNEDQDPGQNRWSSLISYLSKRARASSKKLEAIEAWVSKQEERYHLNFQPTNPLAEATVPDQTGTLEDSKYLGQREY